MRLPLTAASAAQDLERQVQEALSCPCVDHIKSGPCSASFVQAFTCYLKSQASPEVRGRGCRSCSRWRCLTGACAGSGGVPGGVQGHAEVHGQAPASLCRAGRRSGGSCPGHQRSRVGALMTAAVPSRVRLHSFEGRRLSGTNVRVQPGWPRSQSRGTAAAWRSAPGRAAASLLLASCRPCWVPCRESRSPRPGSASKLPARPDVNDGTAVEDLQDFPWAYTNTWVWSRLPEGGFCPRHMHGPHPAGPCCCSLQTPRQDTYSLAEAVGGHCTRYSYAGRVRKSDRRSDVENSSKSLTACEPGKVSPDLGGAAAGHQWSRQQLDARPQDRE